MRNPHGYVTITLPDARPQEMDTASCGHCSAVIFTKPGSASTTYLIRNPADSFGPFLEIPGAGCRRCMTPVCLACYAKGTCTPLERQLEASEARDRLRRAVLG